MNQTRPHCVNQMGKTHSKPLAARHGRRTAWARRAMCEFAFSRPTDATCDRLLFSIYMLYNSTCFERQATVAYKTVSRTDTNTETGGCMYSERLLMMSA
jgi:hypothetical protein